MANINLDQKKLKSLKRQLYGKSFADLEKPSAPNQQNTFNYQFNSKKKSFTKPGSYAGTSYLYKDLKKIAILTTLVVVAQFTLFVLIQRQIISIKFF